ncbi:MAG: hypothetical protein HY934_07035 [Candidatus Firestonebacteria bacterium]|nr:hypothetical protein [Candidatus Firestonebacteria bacterium]
MVLNKIKPDKTKIMRNKKIKMMKVRVEILLTGKSTKKDMKEMESSTKCAAIYGKNVKVFKHNAKENTLVAEFEIEKARQIDVVDNIFHAFAISMQNYNDGTIYFPK